MKTAVSVPDELFEAADTLARRMRVSRSKLYSTALGQFLEKHRGRGITELLNEVYAKCPEDAELDPGLRAIQARSLSDEER